jgi:S-adenosylmethionine hydrolase
MIALFTDYGHDGPYVGQVRAVLAGLAPGIAVIDLMHDLPAYGVRGAAYLLAAYTATLPGDSVCLAVVDPGVGGTRQAVILTAGGRQYIGPDNGLLTVVARRYGVDDCRVIDWRPEQLSASFHGRDLFAPVAARLALGEPVTSRACTLSEPAGSPWPDDLDEILYIDRFGNAVTGHRAACLAGGARLSIGGKLVTNARVFGDVAEGELFWYENSSGLVEIAANRGNAAARLGLKVGDAVGVVN